MNKEKERMIELLNFIERMREEDLIDHDTTHEELVDKFQSGKTIEQLVDEEEASYDKKE